ncbi:SRPBCC domain-containing protein [Conyzicola sp.]|uniref:SRPBCC domain-containing protein n=1 Tax=Conyzicola sp. TaxID=1969404 RepID=UPI0039894AA4
MNDTTGLTKDAGWELGVRRTVAAPLDEVWEYFVVDGLPTWLGNTTLGLHKGDTYRTAEGVSGEIRSRTDQLRLRLTWQPDDWDHDTTLQVTLMQAATGTTIGFHQDRLASAEERARMLEHWTAVLERVVDDLA